MANKIKGLLIQAANEITSLNKTVVEQTEKIANIEKVARVKDIVSKMVEKSIIVDDSAEQKFNELMKETDDKLAAISGVVENIDESFIIGEISKEANNRLSPEEQFMSAFTQNK